MRKHGNPLREMMGELGFEELPPLGGKSPVFAKKGIRIGFIVHSASKWELTGIYADGVLLTPDLTPQQAKEKAEEAIQSVQEALMAYEAMRLTE